MYYTSFYCCSHIKGQGEKRAFPAYVVSSVDPKTTAKNTCDWSLDWPKTAVTEVTWSSLLVKYVLISLQGIRRWPLIADIDTFIKRTDFVISQSIPLMWPFVRIVSSSSDYMVKDIGRWIPLPNVWRKNIRIVFTVKIVLCRDDSNI